MKDYMTAKSVILSILIFNSVVQPLLTLLICMNEGNYKTGNAVVDLIGAVIIYLCYMYVDSKEGK